MTELRPDDASSAPVAFIQAEMKKWARVVVEARIEAE